LPGGIWLSQFSLSDREAAKSSVTGKPEVIGLIVGLVPKNALVVIHSLVVGDAHLSP